MPVLLGVLVGDAFGRGMARVVLSHAFLTMLVWARIGLIVTAGWTLMVLAATDWKLWASFPRLWPSATACVGLWVGQRALIGVLRHSHRRDADASLVMDRQ